jgi:hypothetical protein
MEQQTGRLESSKWASFGLACLILVLAVGVAAIKDARLAKSAGEVH